MIIIENNKYIKICDSCGIKKEISEGSYKRYKRYGEPLCLSCSQKGEKNHRFNKKPWNFGLTKEMSDKVKQYGIKSSQTKKGSTPWNKGCSYEELKGEEWTENFKTKISSTKKGVPNYKRRKSTNRNKSWNYFRKLCKTVLYIKWVRPILERDGFRCQMCGQHKNLEVHHLKSFKKILLEVAKEEGIDLNNYMDLSDDEFETFRNKIIDAHKLEYGVTLCTECHKKIDINRRKFDEKKICN